MENGIKKASGYDLLKAENARLKAELAEMEPKEATLDAKALIRGISFTLINVEQDIDFRGVWNGNYRFNGEFVGRY